MVIRGSIKCHLNVRFHLRPLAPISRAQQFILDEWKQDPPHPVCAPNKCFYLIWPLRHLHSFSTLCQVLFNSKPFNEDSGWNLSRQHIPTWPVSGTWMREGAEQTLSGSSGLIMLSHPKVSSLPSPFLSSSSSLTPVKGSGHSFAHESSQFSLYWEPGRNQFCKLWAFEIN